MVKGDIMRAIDGSYTFSPAAGGSTDVTYTLSIELIVPLPGFVKRRAEVRIVNSVKDLKARVEAACGVPASMSAVQSSSGSSSMTTVRCSMRCADPHQ
jgi:hypothetical protein